MKHIGRGKLTINGVEVGTCEDVSVQTEDRTRECREIDMELTMQNMSRFFGGLTNPVTFSAESESESPVSAAYLLQQMREVQECLDQEYLTQVAIRRTLEIRQVVRVLNPNVDDRTLDRINQHTVILVPDHMVQPGQQLRDFVRASPLLDGEIVLVFDARRMLFHPGSPSVM
ncbi:hypothetical protein [Marinobacter sp. DS40M6]|uniref:hypothetical protein n=1 Tax=Marinobacter sp. DS40M6 TaxID=1597776 RepID=UPI002358DAA7|nr:hypothetical protein [Marinobacter sp. DS40M6]MDC8457798.1 hypothetical protein [Marinobacter sp. DS40M6]